MIAMQSVVNMERYRLSAAIFDSYRIGAAAQQCSHACHIHAELQHCHDRLSIQDLLHSTVTDW
jgi:hypothetical protein